ncbi:MAG: 3-oxoacyl-ACP synthase III family protein, partial [Vicinamibacteria bacterium]
MPNAGILGTGSYLPERIVDNRFLARLFGCDEDWILRRTGIRERRFVRDGQSASTLGIEASRRALEAANVDPADLDLVICATYTPDMSFPSTACLIQHSLNARKAGAFDLQAACSGFVYALITAAQFVATGLYRRVLVVASDVNSSIINPTDRKVTALFGDGAGAAIVGPTDGPGGIISQYMGADGGGGDLFCRPAGGSRMKLTPEALEKGLQYIQMDGPSLFRAGVELMVSASKRALEIAR